MAFKQEVVTVKGKKYSIETLPTEISFIAGLELAAALGGPIEAAAEMFLKSDESKNGIDEETAKKMKNSFAGGLGAMIKSIEPLKMNELLKKILFNNTKKMDGTGVVTFEDFTGDLGAMLELFVYVVNLNYKDFFADLPNIMKAIRPQQVATAESKVQ